MSEIFEKFDPITADFTYVRLLGDRKGIEQKTKVWDKVIVDRSRELMSWVNICQRTVRRGVRNICLCEQSLRGICASYG